MVEDIVRVEVIVEVTVIVKFLYVVLKMNIIHLEKEFKVIVVRVIAKLNRSFGIKTLIEKRSKPILLKGWNLEEKKVLIKRVVFELIVCVRNQVFDVMDGVCNNV